jgi:hypothetical protein
MNPLIERHQEQITGVLSCFDRVSHLRIDNRAHRLFKGGTLTGIIDRPSLSAPLSRKA